jgi:hypothetical protein
MRRARPGLKVVHLIAPATGWGEAPGRLSSTGGAGTVTAPPVSR